MTIVFQIVPGAFTQSHWYNGIRDGLISHGHEAFVTKHLSSGVRDPLPPATMQEDAANVRADALVHIRQGKSVIIVTHSYGGVVGTEACRGLLHEDQENPETAGGVIRIVYLTAFMLQPGFSVLKASGGQLPPFMKLIDGYVSHDPEESAKVTFSDIPLAEGIHMVQAFPPHSAASFQGEVSYPAYSYIPVSYVVCMQDTIIPPGFQRDMIRAVEENYSKRVDVAELPTGHNAFSSMPEAAAEKIIGTCFL